MEPKLSVKSTKNELLAAYEDMLKRLEDSKNDEPKKEQEVKKNKEIILEASTHSSDSLIKAINQLKIILSKELDALSGSLIDEQKKLEQLQQAISLEKKNLDELYQINVEADSLAALIQAQISKKETFEKAMADQNEALLQNLSEQKLKLELDIANTRENWLIEKQKGELEQKEKKAEQEKLRKREEEEYTYSINQIRKKDTDTYNTKKETLENELKDKKIIFEKEIAEREQVVAIAELELKELRLKADKFPVELEKAVKQATSILEEKLTNQYQFEKQLLAQKTEGEISLKDQTISSLKEKIAEQDAFIKELNGKANNAEKNVKDIAIKAIESSGKMQIFEKKNDTARNE